MKKKDNLQNKSERRCFGIRLKPELVKRLKLMAINEDKPVNRLLEQAILEFLKRQKA